MNFPLHKGCFESSVYESTLSPLRADLPILVWIDVEYCGSARAVLGKLIPYLPNGCVIHFYEYDNLNYGSRLTGEARPVNKINQGVPGEEIVLDLGSGTVIELAAQLPPRAFCRWPTIRSNQAGE
jgi:hypothetical protein